MSGAARLVVVGADAAGMSAAHQALRGARRRGRRLDVIALERTAHTSYSACGIPYWIAGDVATSDQLVARTPAEHRDRGLDIRMGSAATEIDLAAGTVSYLDDGGQTRVLEYDDLMLASGAEVVTPGWALDASGVLISGVLPVKTIDDGTAWLDLLAAHRGAQVGRAVVIGGGYIGLEMAEVMMRSGLATTLITRSRVMSTLDPDMSTRIEKALLDAGVEVITDMEVAQLETSPVNSVTGLVMTDGRRLQADLVVIGMGARPATSLGAAAGIPLGSAGGYLPDSRGRLVDGVWSAGDCCESIHRVTGQRVFLPLGTHANKQGRVAGENISGGSAAFGGVLGTAITRFVTDLGHVEVARTGLSSAEADAAGLDAVALTTDGRTASGYMPEASQMATHVLAERGTRRLLGAQIVGGRGSAKRIDTLAAALWGAMTVDDVADMDLAYAPPFATVWEAVQLAARRLADRM